jgi:hypothetical protein
MKLRSCLLFACMAIVPLAAMFSHKIPRDWRLAVQRLARGEAPMAFTTRPSEPPQPTAPPVAAAAPPLPTPPRPSSSSPRDPAPASAPAALQPIAPPIDVAPALPLPSQPAPAGAPAVEDAARSRLVIEDQLRTLGAVSIECVPMMQGTSYRCSCRVPADPSGQLQRVFQSSNPDPVVALRNLHGQVQFWKHRLATRPDAGNPLRTSGDGSATGLR